MMPHWGLRMGLSQMECSAAVKSQLNNARNRPFRCRLFKSCATGTYRLPDLAKSQLRFYRLQLPSMLSKLVETAHCSRYQQLVQGRPDAIKTLLPYHMLQTCLDRRCSVQHMVVMHVVRCTGEKLAKQKWKCAKHTPRSATFMPTKNAVRQPCNPLPTFARQ